MATKVKIDEKVKEVMDGFSVSTSEKALRMFSRRLRFHHFMAFKPYTFNMYTVVTFVGVTIGTTYYVMTRPVASENLAPTPGVIQKTEQIISEPVKEEAKEVRIENIAPKEIKKHKTIIKDTVNFTNIVKDTATIVVKDTVSSRIKVIVKDTVKVKKKIYKQRE